MSGEKFVSKKRLWAFAINWQWLGFTKRVASSLQRWEFGYISVSKHYSYRSMVRPWYCTNLWSSNQLEGKSQFWNMRGGKVSSKRNSSLLRVGLFRRHTSHGYVGNGWWFGGQVFYLWKNQEQHFQLCWSPLQWLVCHFWQIRFLQRGSCRTQFF